MLQLRASGWLTRASISNPTNALSRLKREFGNHPKVRTCFFRRETIPVHVFEISFDFGTGLVVLAPETIEVSSPHFMAVMHISMFVRNILGVTLEPV